MATNDDIPIIVGAGLTGVAISHYLSQARMPHLLLGAVPGDQPRLGESIDPAGTVALLEFFPEYAEFYFPKRYVSVYSGKYASICDFKANRMRSLGLRMLGFRSGDEFVHVDRIGFDKALAARTLARPECTHENVLVDSLQYDEASDRIERVRLADGRELRPRYLFDATNHLRLAAKAANVPIQWVSRPQRVVFCHYRMAASRVQACEDSGWKHCTSLLRLYRHLDGIDGMAWCIPLGSYVSIGISVEASDEEPDPETIVALVTEAYARRGLEVREQFPERSEVIALRNRYFIHERAYGGNWLLAGPSFGQAWFPSSSGVGCALLAGAIAPQLVRSPDRWGEAFEQYVRALLRSHVLFDEMISAEDGALSRDRIRNVAEEIAGENIKRVARLAQFHSGPAARLFARLLHAGAPFMEAGWQVIESDLSAQTSTMFETA